MAAKLGYWGSGPISNFHIPALQSVGCNPTVVYSRPRSERLISFADRWDLIPCSSESEFLNRCKSLDGIVIALETSITPFALRSALTLGLPIMVEKPGAPGSLQLEEATKSRDKSLLCFSYNRRVYESVQYAKNFLENKSDVLIQACFPDSIKGMWQFKINGCHMVDALAFISGKLKLEGAWGNLDSQKSGFMVQMTSERTHHINLNCNWGTADNVSIKISTGEDTLVFRGFEEVVHYKGMKINEPTPNFPLRVYQPHEVHRENTSLLQGKPGFYKQALNFREFITNGHFSSDFCDYSQAIQVLKTIEKIEDVLLK